jgi:N-acyl-D-amino-acid deacylase
MGRLVFRGGTVVDGTRSPARTADVLVEDGVIAEVGRVDTVGAEVRDADGLLVTPGWIDAHTHYDGQVFWDPLMTPSSWHGTTTVVMGNCGVGFAPVRPGAELGLMELMTKIEDIPTDTLQSGMPWGWESYGDYLDALDRCPRAIDVGGFVPHGVVRTYVMGERAERGEPTPGEIEQMAALIDDAIRAGALGCSFNRSQKKGTVVPGSFAGEDELFAMAKAVGAHGAILQSAPAFVGDEDWTSEAYESDLLRRQSLIGKCLVTFTLVQDHKDPVGWRRILDFVDQANAEGARLVPQVLSRPLNALFSLTARHPFEQVPVYQELVGGATTLAEKVARMSDPAVRDKILTQAAERLGSGQRFQSLYAMSNPPNYEPDPSTSISAGAARAGLSPVEVFYDKLLEDGGEAMFLYVAANYAYGNSDVTLEMIKHPDTITAIGDGGAHCLTLVDCTAPTTMLSHWARDRQGERISLEFAVHELSEHPAEVLGLHDRGVLAPGRRADINLIDFENLTMGRLEFVNDLPGGNRRLIQRSTGYVATYVAGEHILDNGSDTGNRPGRTLRHRQ